MTMMKTGQTEPGRTFTYVCELTDGEWFVRVPDLPSVHTQAKSLDQAERRIRAALSLWLDVTEGEHVPPESLSVQAAVATGSNAVLDEALAATALNRAADEQRDLAKAALRQASDHLIDRLGLSHRDAARLLGVSHGRIGQLLNEFEQAEEHGGHERPEALLEAARNAFDKKRVGGHRSESGPIDRIDAVDAAVDALLADSIEYDGADLNPTRAVKIPVSGS